MLRSLFRHMRIYLDHNATTPLDPLVAERMTHAVERAFDRAARRGRLKVQHVLETPSVAAARQIDDRDVIEGTSLNNWCARSSRLRYSSGAARTVMYDMIPSSICCSLRTELKD